MKVSAAAQINTFIKCQLRYSIIQQLKIHNIIYVFAGEMFYYNLILNFEFIFYLFIFDISSSFFFHSILYSYLQFYFKVILQSEFKSMFQHQFDCKEIQAALPAYKYVKRLGSGAFAVVHLVQKRDTNELLALKKVSCFGMNQYEKSGAENQAKILSQLNHQNIIKVKDCLFDDVEDIMYIFMEYAQSGDLSSLIQQASAKKKRIPETTVWKVIYDISNGLSYLHRNHILHRDLKPANIFRKGKFFKIGDMNVSKIMKNGVIASTKTGSPLYTAPQVWDSEQYNQKCDVWSLGILIHELCCLKVPFQADNIIQLLNKIRSQRPKSIPSFYSSSLDQLLNRMIENQPKKRISAEQVFKISCQKIKLETSGLGDEQADHLMDTIVFPDTHHKWASFNPTSLPPKTSRVEITLKSEIDQTNIKSVSKQKSGKKSFKGNASNIFRSNEKRPPLNIPKSNSRNKAEDKKQQRQEKKQNIGGKIPNLPPIYRSNSPMASRKSVQKREGLSSSRGKRQSAIQLVIETKSIISGQNGN